MAEEADAAVYIVHMNTGGEVDMLKYARERGVKVMGETCPQYLFFTEDALGGKMVQNGSARRPCAPEVDNARLWQGLQMEHCRRSERIIAHFSMMGAIDHV